MSACPRCGVEVACGMTQPSNNGQPCWCTQFPGVLPVPAAGAASCYCPQCLPQVIAQAVAQRQELGEN